MAGNLVPPKLSEALQAPSGVGLPQVPEDNGLAFPTEPVDDGGVQWSRYVAALRRYRWLILLITVLGTAAGVVATRFLKPLYSVQATIWIDNSTEASSGPIRAGGLLHSFAWQELLTTYTVLDSVIQKERLYLELARPADSLAFQGFSLKPRFKAGKYALDIDANGRFLLKTQEGLTMQKGTAGDSIGGTIGFAWQPPAAALGRDRTIKFTVYTPRQASELLQEDLSTQMAENGNFLRLSLTGTDPTRLASTLNTLTTQFVSVAADLKKGKLTETSKALEQQLDTIGQRLRQRARGLQDPDHHAAERVHRRCAGRRHHAAHGHDAVLQSEGADRGDASRPAGDRERAAARARRRPRGRCLPDHPLGADRPGPEQGAGRAFHRRIRASRAALSLHARGEAGAGRAGADQHPAQPDDSGIRQRARQRAPREGEHADADRRRRVARAAVHSEPRHQ
jgi:hypothetical protein